MVALLLAFTLAAPAPFPKPGLQRFLCGNWQMSWTGTPYYVELDANGQYRCVHGYEPPKRWEQWGYNGTWQVHKYTLIIREWSGPPPGRTSACSVWEIDLQKPTIRNPTKFDGKIRNQGWFALGPTKQP